MYCHSDAERSGGGGIYFSPDLLYDTQAFAIKKGVFYRFALVDKLYPFRNLPMSAHGRGPFVALRLASELHYNER